MSRTKKLTRLRRREREAREHHEQAEAIHKANEVFLRGLADAYDAELATYRQWQREMRATGRTSRMVREALLSAVVHPPVSGHVFVIAHTSAYAKTLEHQVQHLAEQYGAMPAFRLMKFLGVEAAALQLYSAAAVRIFFDHYVYETNKPSVAYRKSLDWLEKRDESKRRVAG